MNELNQNTSRAGSQWNQLWTLLDYRGQIMFSLNVPTELCWMSETQRELDLIRPSDESLWRWSWTASDEPKTLKFVLIFQWVNTPEASSVQCRLDTDGESCAWQQVQFWIQILQLHRSTGSPIRRPGPGSRVSSDRFTKLDPAPIQTSQTHFHALNQVQT